MKVERPEKRSCALSISLPAVYAACTVRPRAIFLSTRSVNAWYTESPIASRNRVTPV